MDSYSSPKMLVKIAAVFILVISVTGIVYSARAAVAHLIHKSIRYEDELLSRKDPERAEARARRAHSLYPYNYYLCIWIAENSWYYRYDESGKEVARRVELADRWCSMGMDLNRRKSQLRLLAARIIARESPADAAAYWKEYVDWHFWDAYNHAALVEFYAAAGDLESAGDELRWVEGTRHHKHASSQLKAAWQREMQMTP